MNRYVLVLFSIALLCAALFARAIPAAQAQPAQPGTPIVIPPDGELNPAAPPDSGEPIPANEAPVPQTEWDSHGRLTISWVTLTAEPAWLELSATPDGPFTPAYDDRGRDVVDTVHRVTWDLPPAQTVYYRIITDTPTAIDAPVYKAVRIVPPNSQGLPGGTPNPHITETTGNEQTPTGNAPRATNATNRIGIEAGHWPTDPGAMSCDGVYRESDNTIGVANAAADILRAYGYTVDVMNAGDARLNGYTADAFVALHNDWCPKDGAGNPTWKSGFKVSRRGGAAGTGVNGSNDGSDRLANAVWDRYARATGLPKDQQPGHFTQNMLWYYALGRINPATPGVIIEMGWWHGDRDMLLNQRGALAAGVAESVFSFLGRADGDDARVIASGQTTTGTITPNNDRDTYYFSGNQGQSVTITLYQSSTALDPYLELYGPRGNLVTQNDDSDGLNSRILNFSLPQSGRYRIIARSYAYGSSGGYTLALNPTGNPVSCPDGQFRADYWTNRTLSGAAAHTRCENPPIPHDWGGGSPAGSIPPDNFSARWAGRFNFSGGNTRFIARADDGVRVWLDGALIIDGWRDQPPTEYRAERNLSAGLHEIRMEYYENGGGAVAQLRWEAIGSGVSCPGQYKAEYWTNRSLSGSPALTRCEGWPINQDWGGGSPGGIPNDNFSARWTGRATINAGTYTFIARADDGVRVWLDGSILIDQWRDQGPTEYRATRTIGGGEHDIRVEYYENGGGAIIQFRWEAANSGGGGNLALNRPATASSQESSTYSPPRGNDGNNSTRWSSMISSTLGAQRWFVDLGSARSFSRVRINWEAAYAATYRIVWSDDGVTWYYSGSDNTRSGPGWAEHNFSTRTRRYVGVTMLTRAPRMNNYSFFEFELFGPTLTGAAENIDLIETDVPDLQQ